MIKERTDTPLQQILQIIKTLDFKEVKSQILDLFLTPPKTMIDLLNYNLKQGLIKTILKHKDLFLTLNTAPLNSPLASILQKWKDYLFQINHLLSEKKISLFSWDKIRTEQQLPTGDWRTWLILAGRGFGKTRAGAEAIRKWIETGKCKRIALIGSTEKDVLQVMIGGVSGIESLYPVDHPNRPSYNASKGMLCWPNGAIAQIFTCARPDKLRGPQFDGAWIDEMAKFRNPQLVWDQLNYALRLGENPQIIVTTTPRPIPIINTLLKAEGQDVIVTRGSTFANLQNLSPHFIKYLKEKYDKTRMGQQEIYGEILDTAAGALWQETLLENLRTDDIPTDFQRVVIGIDPAVTSHERSDETGIIVAGLGQNGKAYVLADLSGRLPGNEWSKRVVKAYKDFHVDRVVAEVNKGGDLIEQTLRVIAPTISFKAVRATRSKVLRAEPIAALYEQGKVFHVRKGLEKLEQQMLSYTPEFSSKSPDRLDALVWTLTDLLVTGASRSSAQIWE